ncbi:MAG: glycosyl transferase family protein [Hyphomicrobiales bacterium]|nr:glycosyl transferase family protein [Hyphomicrobiales bacterium]
MTDVSVVVCTRNRAHAILNCLQSIADSAAHCEAKAELQIVVVDNGSRDGTASIVREWARNSPIAVDVVEQPRVGLSVARNSGVATARGRLVVFTDDDCRLELNYIKDLLAHDATDSGPVLRGGRVELGDATDLPFTVKTDCSTFRYHIRKTNLRMLHLGGCILGCNMAMRREVIEKVGDFDERFGAGGMFPAAEDTDFIFRAYLAGFPIEYVPDMTVRHYHGRKSLADIQQLLRNYDLGEGAIYAKYALRHPAFVRQFYWDLKASLRELFGPKTYQPQFGVFSRHKIARNIRGIFSYAFKGLRA